MAEPLVPPFTPATPEAIENRASLSAIQYRIGRYASFRRAMLEAISGIRRPPEEGAGPLEWPLRAWTTRASDDFGIAFLEMWAYLADVLTFYQERIANEAFIGTSVQPESLTLLSGLIGYRPAPGRAAETYLAFEAEKGATVELSPGLLVQSVPGQDEVPQKFETVEPVTAYAALNVMRPRRLKRQQLSRGSHRAVLQGIGHNLVPGDWVAIVGDKRRNDPGSEVWDVRALSAVEEDRESNVTLVEWEEGLGTGARPWRGPIDPDPNPEFWVFRGKAHMFGHNAPDFRLLKDLDLVGIPDPDGKYLPEEVQDLLDAEGKPIARAHPERIYLDAVYPGLLPGGWISLVTSEIDQQLRGYHRYVELYPILEVAETTRVNYTLTANVSRVSVDVMAEGDDAGKPEHIGFFSIRATTALIRSERLPLAEVPIGHSSIARNEDVEAALDGQAIELDGYFPDLRPNRTLLLEGSRLDDGQGITDAVRVATVTHVGMDAPGDEKRTTVTLAAPLATRWVLDSLRIYGNVATATHGETVADEIVGNGDASQAFQAFALKKGPLTYVAKAGAPGGVASTLVLRIDGVRWDGVPELYGQPNDARVFVVRHNSADGTRVQTGDGEIGARPTSGRGNVRATYRVGLGPAGNVGGGSLRTVLKKPVGLKGSTNPAAAVGGTGAEAPEAVRQNAPGTIRTFGRIVSLRDFEDAAKEYVGVAKAQARWDWDGERRIVDLVAAGDAGASIELIRGAVRRDLDARRDPHQPLRIRDFRAVPVSVALRVKAHEAYLLEDVRAAAEAALRQLFAFENLELGQSVSSSAVFEALHPAKGPKELVEGVIAVDLDEFRFKWATARVGRGGDALVQRRLLVAPGEIAWVEDAVTDLRVEACRDFGGTP